jgi:hypothetical protein
MKENPFNAGDPDPESDGLDFFNRRVCCHLPAAVGRNPSIAPSKKLAEGREVSESRRYVTPVALP